MGDVVVVHVGVVDAFDGATELIEATVVGEVGVPSLDIEVAGDVFGDFRDGEVAEVVSGFHFGAGGDAGAAAYAAAHGGDEFSANRGVAVGHGGAVAVFDPLDAAGGGSGGGIGEVGGGGGVPCGAVPFFGGGDRIAGNHAKGGFGFGNQLPFDEFLGEGFGGADLGDGFMGVGALGDGEVFPTGVFRGDGDG